MVWSRGCIQVAKALSVMVIAGLAAMAVSACTPVPGPTVMTPAQAPAAAEPERPAAAAPTVSHTPAPGPAPAPTATPTASAPPRTRAPAPVRAPVVAAVPKPAAASAPAARAPAPAAAPAVASRPAAPALDLGSLEQRLRDTRAIGVFTKLSLKNQVDDLLSRFRDFYGRKSTADLAQLRQKYDLLLLKVLSVLQDGDPGLASTIAASKENLWALLADPQKFSTLDH